MLSFSGTPKREETFEEKARNFSTHAAKLASTARSLAKSGGCNDRRTVEGIQTAAQQVHTVSIVIVLKKCSGR